MKIVEAISDMNIGGAGILLLSRLSVAPKSYRDSTTVILPTGSELSSRLKTQGINYIELDACKNRSFEPFSVLKYMGLLKKDLPDIVNCHGNLSFRIAAFLCRVPVRLYTRHCSFPAAWWEKFLLIKFLVGKTQCVLSNGIIAVAYAAKDDLVRMGVDEKRITVIVNGARRLKIYDTNKIREIKKEVSILPNTTVVSIFARLEPYKDHMCFIQAAKLLIERGLDVHFLIVGSGSLEQKLKEYCDEFDISDKISFIGYTDNVEKYMNITDINVNCSIGTETSSLALSEGMGLSIPCVVSNFGGNPYMVREGDNGLIYPCGDALKLADAVERLCIDKELYKRLSWGAKKRFDAELNVDIMTKKAYAFYEAMIDRYLGKEQSSRE